MAVNQSMSQRWGHGYGQHTTAALNNRHRLGAFDRHRSSRCRVFLDLPYLAEVGGRQKWLHNHGRLNSTSDSPSIWRINCPWFASNR
jgi:hypothetical protein